jgi:hypothetical protein
MVVPRTDLRVKKAELPKFFFNADPPEEQRGLSSGH